MHILNILGSVKKWQQSNSNILYLKAIIEELYLLKKTIIIQWKVEKKVLLLLGTKLIKQIPHATILDQIFPTK